MSGFYDGLKSMVSSLMNSRDVTVTNGFVKTRLSPAVMRNFQAKMMKHFTM